MIRSIVVAVCVALFSALPAAAAPDMVLPIVGGVDGDTIRTHIEVLPCPLCKVSVRIRGIDTPERGSRAKCAQEAAHAAEASKMMKALIGTNRTMIVKDATWDKYGGRINGVVFINNINVGDELILAGFARAYTGKGPKPNWCS